MMVVRTHRIKGGSRPARMARMTDSAASLQRRPRRTDSAADRPGLLRFLPVHTLRSRLTLLIGLPLLLFQASGIGLDYALERAGELDDLEQQLAQQTQITASDIDMQLALVSEAARSNAGLFADSPKLSDYERHRALRRAVESHPAVYSAALAFEPWITRLLPQVYRSVERQRIETIDLNRPDYDLRREPWYRQARTETEAFWIGPHTDAGTGTAVISCVAPILRSGGFAGTVTIDLTAESLRARLGRGRAGTEFLALIDAGGSILINADGRSPAATLAELAQVEQQPVYAEVVRGMAAGGHGAARFPGRGPGQGDRVLVHRRVSTNGWSVLAVLSAGEALQPVHKRVLRQSLVYGFGSFGILVLLWWATRAMTRPITALGEAAQKVSEGRLDVRVEEPLGDDEIGRFARTFNRMLADLKENVASRLHDAAARQNVETELAIARKIQQSLLPEPYADTLAVEISGDVIPAPNVAADFYDWFRIDGDTLGVAIADVSGRGIAAAQFMAAIRNSLRGYGAGTRGPAEALTALNRSLTDDKSLTMFVTVFYGHYHIPSGRLLYANAGHNPPYIVRSNGVVESLGDATGPLLAVLAEALITDGEARLEQGDALVLYSDGVTEACDPDGRPYDEKRLELALKNGAGESAEAICARIRYAVGDHCKGPPQDDVTLLVLRRNT